MNIKKFNSIRHKTLFYLILFSVFILSILWGIQVFLSDYLYEKYQIKDMNRIANEISFLTSDKLDDYLADVVYNNSVCVEYINKRGISTLYNVNSPGCLLGRNKIDLSEYIDDLEDSDEDTQAIKLSNPDYKSYALLYGVKVDNGYVFLFTMLSSVNKNLNIIKGQLIYIMIVVIILAVFISLFLARLISDPIVKMSKQTRLLAAGNYDINFAKNGIEEIDELADTLNYLESEVRKTDQYRRDLMANVSHDLKTPLTMIKAYAEMVRDISYKNKEKREEHLNVIIDEADRLNILVGDILTLSRLQENSDVLNLEYFDLIEVINDVVKKYDIVRELEDYKIICEMPDNALVKADKNKLTQVIYNLVNNAINYTGDDKTVKVNVTIDKKDYLVEIKDSGKGIKDDEIKFIWDKYYKNEKNHKRNKVGTGLGLSIVKNILEGHNFKYGVLSKKNKGTTFYFRIPKSNKKK